eukprot:scaffold16.g112.t1
MLRGELRSLRAPTPVCARLPSPQQCGKFQNVKEFDGDKKSCRRMLLAHKQRRQHRIADATGATAASKEAAGVGAGATQAGTSGSGTSTGIRPSQNQKPASKATAEGGEDQMEQDKHQEWQEKEQSIQQQQSAAPVPAQQQPQQGQREQQWRPQQGQQEQQQQQDTSTSEGLMDFAMLEELFKSQSVLAAAPSGAMAPSAEYGAQAVGLPHSQPQLQAWAPHNAARPLPLAPPPGAQQLYTGATLAGLQLPPAQQPPSLAGSLPDPNLVLFAPPDLGQQQQVWLPLAPGAGFGLGCSMEGWLARAEGLVGPPLGNPAVVVYQAHHLSLERLSLKVFDCMPEQLMPAVRADLEQLVPAASALHIEGALRPGCVHLTLTALLDAAAGPGGSGEPGLRARLEALLASPDSPLGSLLRSAGAVAQVGSRVALIEEGRVKLEVAAEADSAPEIRALRPPCICVAAPPHLAASGARASWSGGRDGGGSEAGVEDACELGAHSLELGVPLQCPNAAEGLVLCRQRARHLAVEVLGSSIDVQRQLTWVRAWPVGLVPGCAELEMQVGNILSGARPLLVLPDPAAAAEVRCLAAAGAQLPEAAPALDAFLREVGLVVQFTHRHVDPAAGGSGPAQPFPPVLRRCVAAAARRLVAVAAARGCPALVALLLEGVCADGSVPQEAAAGMDAACPSSLLHVVAGSGCPVLVGVLQAWAARGGLRWPALDPAAAERPGSRGLELSVLHVAAVVPDGGAMLAALAALDPPSAERLWTAPLPDGAPSARQLACTAERRRIKRKGFGASGPDGSLEVEEPGAPLVLLHAPSVEAAASKKLKRRQGHKAGDTQLLLRVPGDVSSRGEDALYVRSSAALLRKIIKTSSCARASLGCPLSAWPGLLLFQLPLALLAMHACAAWVGPAQAV